MPFPVACHSCSAPKSPLLPCESCGAEARPADEHLAWRQALRRHHMALLLAPPVAPAAEPAARPSAPRRVVISLAQARDTIGSEIGRLIAAGDEGDGSTPLSFDWHDRRRLRRLRRTG